MNTKKTLIEAALLGLFLFALLAILGRGFGPYWDSWFYYDQASRWGDWFGSWWGGEEARSLLEEPEWYFPDQTEYARHPPFLEIGGGFFNGLFGGVIGELSSCRLIVELFASLFSAASYVFLKPRCGRGLAILGVLLFWGSPRFFLHAVLFAIDGLIAAVYGLALLSFLLWDKGRWGKAVIFAALVLGLLTKLQSLYLFPILFLWLAWKVFIDPNREIAWRNRLAREWGKAALLSTAVFVTAFILWPANWMNWPEGFKAYLEFISRHSNIPVLYFGKLYVSESHPPWHYPWVYTMIAVPLWVTLPVISRAIRLGVRCLTAHPADNPNNGAGNHETCAEIPFSAQLPEESLPPDRTEEFQPSIQANGERQHEGIRVEVGSRRDSRTRRFEGTRYIGRTLNSEEFLLWMGMLFPLLVSSMPQAPKYDGIRLLLPAYGPMTLLAALEISRWWHWGMDRYGEKLSSMIRTALLVLLMLLVLLPSLRIYPHNLVYYSPLIGGPKGAHAAGFELEYLGVTLHQLNPVLAENARPGDILLLAGANAVVHPDPKESWPPFPNGILVADFKLLNDFEKYFPGFDLKRHQVFAILSSRYADLRETGELVLEKVPPLAMVEYEGERLFSLHRIPERFVRELPALIEEDKTTP